MVETTAESLITDAVRRLYEAYPYPKYPLLARPRWQEGYLCTSLFSTALYEDLKGSSPSMRLAHQHGTTSVLAVGAGEITPVDASREIPFGKGGETVALVNDVPLYDNTFVLAAVTC